MPVANVIPLLVGITNLFGARYTANLLNGNNGQQVTFPINYELRFDSILIKNDTISGSPGEISIPPISLNNLETGLYELVLQAQVGGIPTEKRFTLKPFITDIIVDELMATSATFGPGNARGTGGNAPLLG